jgi:hypothetical protein
MTPGLALAIEQVAERMNAGIVSPPSVEKNLLAQTNLGEFLGEWEQRGEQQEGAAPAA